MANAIYPNYKEKILQNTANYSLAGSGATGPYVQLCDTGTHAYNAADDMYNDLSGMAGTEQELTGGKSYTGGTFKSTDVVTFTAVAGTVSYEAMIFFVKNAGANSTWPLVVFIDTGQTGLPVTSNGGNITITPDAAGWFSL